MKNQMNWVSCLVVLIATIGLITATNTTESISATSTPTLASSSPAAVLPGATNSVMVSATVTPTQATSPTAGPSASTNVNPTTGPKTTSGDSKNTTPSSSASYTSVSTNLFIGATMVVFGKLFLL